MDSFNSELLKRLSEVAGVPGREERVRELIRAELEGVVDSLSEDAMGNLIAFKGGNTEQAKRVMLSAHMDEIGFYVSFIDDKGFLRVNPAGGFDARTLFARQVTVHARGGDLVGVLNPATKPIHILPPDERGKVPQLHEFAIDLGMSGEAVKERVRVGDPVTLIQECRDLGAVVTGKAMDDRASCWIQIETLKRLQEPAYDVYAVFSVQEEVGLRGARTGAYHIEPDIGIALDVTLAVDTPGGAEHQRVSELGKGVALKVMDSSAISTRWLLDAFIQLAEAEAIPYQLEVLPLGGTDAGAIQLSRAGVPSLTLSTPTRYIHTVTEMVSKSDLGAAVKLLTAYLEAGKGED
ncbi:MAG: M42 family metallopeptidase [Deinococcota bacterium]|nr:M42 family metallopeptidase [Deinococcota bacterium]